MYGQGIISLEALKELTKDIKIRRAALENQIKRLESQKEKYDQTPNFSVDEICNKVPLVLQELIKEEKKKAIRKLIKEIIVNEERTYVTIRGRIPLQVHQSSVYESITRDYRLAECGQINSF